MALDAKILRKRLAFIRHLYQRGVDQARQPHPLDAMSVLMFHDAVELFMHLALEHHDPARKKGQFQFMQYFDYLPQLRGRTSIDRLNDARVVLKHSGLPAAPDSVAEFPSIVLNFFDENCPTLLGGIIFSHVSMIDLIHSAEVRSHVQTAEQAMADGDGVTAVGEIALAFAKLVDAHEVIGAPPESVNVSRAPFSSQRFWNSSEIEQLRSVVSVLALGIDHRRWARFRRIAPYVVRVSTGDLHYGLAEGEGPPPEMHDVRYCFDFVVENALKLEADGD